jgi:urea carboxylase-associated protein 2
MSQTATARGARDHARAQATTTSSGFGPTIPVRDLEDPPTGVVRDALLWDETLEPGGYAARVLPRGAVVRLVDVDGDACANVIVHNALLPTERLNVADTVKVQWQAYLGGGSLLLSDMGRVLMTIVDDTSGRHDTLCGSSNAARNAAKYGSGGVHGPHPNGRDRFAVAIAKFGLDRRDIPPSINLFKGVRVEADGSLRFQGEARPGGSVELLAELPVLFTVVNTPHVLDPRPGYNATALRVTAWRDAPTSPDGPRWRSSPEAERAYLQTADFMLGR